jgi:surface antigen
VHTALPLLALGALALLAALRPAASVPLAGSGVGAVTPVLEGRVITDGHPQLLTPVPVRRLLAVARPVPAAAPRPAARSVRHVAGPVRVTATAPAPARSAVPRARAAAADAYPYATDTSGGADPWGFTKRQCVSYVAWRLAEEGRPLDNARDHWGSALDWDDVAARLGYPVSSRPAVGAVAQWDAGEHSAYWSGASSSSDGTFVAGAAGHVAWVTAVYSDGSVQVAQYNGTGDRSFSTMRVRAPRYLSL